MYKEKLKFNENGKFVIMQVSDAQDMHIPRRAMLKMLNKAYGKVNPDMVVLTGDNILGNHINDAPIGKRKNVKTKEGTLKRMETALGYVLKPLEKRKIPFAFIYGNHDDMNCISKDEQAQIYKKYDYCIPFNEDDKSVDCDTYNVPIYSKDGSKVKYNLWMLDSAGSDENGNSTYDGVEKKTVQWYERKSDEMTKENGGEPIMSLMFQHIPIPRVSEFFKKCKSDDKSAVKGPDGNFYKLNHKKAKGFAFEYPNSDTGDTSDNGLLEAVKSRDDVSAMVFGHDHLNSFVGKIDGINIVQTPGASFRSYGNMVSRGVRIFTIDENDTSSFETYTISYFDLFGKNFISVMRYIFNADEYEKIKTLVVVLLVILLIGIISYLLSIFHILN